MLLPSVDVRLGVADERGRVGHGPRRDLPVAPGAVGVAPRSRSRPRRRNVLPSADLIGDGQGRGVGPVVSVAEADDAVDRVARSGTEAFREDGRVAALVEVDASVEQRLAVVQDVDVGRRPLGDAGERGRDLHLAVAAGAVHRTTLYSPSGPG